MPVTNIISDPLGLGVDFSCVEDCDKNLTVVTGKLGLAQAIARRLTTNRGGLWYDENYGWDIKSLLNEGVNDTDLPYFQSQIENECLKDERVSSADVELTLNRAAQSLSILAKLDVNSAPFQFTLFIDQVSSKIFL